MQDEDIIACNHRIIILANLMSMWHDNMHHCLEGDTKTCDDIIKHIDNLERDINQLADAKCISPEWGETLKKAYRDDVEIAKKRKEV